MATSNEPLQLNLGSLRSAMSLTLHTHHASRIWHGRAAAEGRPGIVGLNGYIAVMNNCLLYTSPSPRDRTRSRMPSSA